MFFPDVVDADALPAPLPKPTYPSGDDHSVVTEALKRSLYGLPCCEGLKESLTALVDVLEAINAEDSAVTSSTLSRQLWTHYLPLLFKYLDKVKSICPTANMTNFYLEVIRFTNTVTNSCYEILDGIYENELMDIKAETNVLNQLAAAERMVNNVYD